MEPAQYSDKVSANAFCNSGVLETGTWGPQGSTGGTALGAPGVHRAPQAGRRSVLPGSTGKGLEMRRSLRGLIFRLIV